MRATTLRRVAALGLSGAIVLGAVSQGAAAPVPAGTATMKSAVASQVTDVRWRGRGVAAGIAAGLIVGGLAAGAYPYYYGPGYDYGGPAYYYEPAPVYVEPPATYYAPPYPNGARRQCYVATDDGRGYGYWRPC